MPEATQREWLEYIYRDSERLTAIVDDVLNVSRVHSDRLRTNLVQMPLQDAVNKALATIRPMTDKHEFVVEIASDIPQVVADREKLSQVLINLLDNAVKYSPKGGRITVSARHEGE